ncbi:unnamed protein product [Triticum turgidum subsp. durum]|uniref:Homeobox domain-containing protein n=1 Tax=Triticum turgidum subsp. durum TaxID=4567 RepID=A0A9R0VD25_TRITD|nr:unnamed protein product [Triticum turgidum subsp. durum]
MDSSGDGGDDGPGAAPGSPAPASSSAPSAGAAGAAGPGGASGSSGKPTARRVMKTPYQLEVLEQTYTEDPYPNEAKRVELSAKLGLTDRQLQMWFCHRRLKDRRPPPAAKRRDEEVAVPVLAPPPVLPHPHAEPAYGEQLLLPCSSSRRGPGRSSAVPRISAPEIDRRYYEAHPVMLPPQAPVQLTRAAHRAIETVQQLIGEPLREDGPVLGDHFDPLPPGAFGAPMPVGMSVMPIVLLSLFFVYA